ncbi:hypothetical protein BASA83_007605 [Batrachochytrium salamandrivorans]|nr:hypothetical protein BASA83_007605 [Batrachochytrium salamandrivorans]
MYSSRFPGFDSLVPMMSMPVQQALAGNSGSEPTATALATRQRLRHVPSVRRPAPHYKTEALRVIKAETAAETALLHEDIVIQARLKRAIDMAEQEVRRLKDMVDTCTWRRVAKTQQN